jgi:cbb3-type cytochrome oxidase subunit 3
MTKTVLVRLAGAAGLLALALFFVGLGPFLSAGASPTNPISVDRSFKADRLPVSHQAAVLPDWAYEFSAFNPQARAQKPFACDPAFSTIASQAAANFFGRCLA